MKFTFTTHFCAFGSNVFLALEIINFEDVFLTKVIHFYVIKKLDAFIYYIGPRCSQKIFISSTQ
jgi:hypothetical protein